MRWFPHAVVLLMVMSCAGPEGTGDQPAGPSAIFARFGTGYTSHFHGDSPRLEVHLTGRRWRGMRSGVSDSARVVARHALNHLPEGMPRPDTIVVTFLTRSWNFLIASSQTTIGDTIAVAEL